MSEVYASNEVTAELLDPIDGSVITSVSIPYRRDLTLSERPVYAQRGYHRSSTLSAAHLRSLGSVSIRKDADSMALAAEIKRWQKGVTFYALSSDLKGQRYRHPHLRVTFTNADGSTDVQTAYNVKLSDRSLSAPDGGIVGDSISLDVLGGFEPKAGGYEPVRALDFHRTGSATHLSTAGTLTTAGDGVARIGLPWVVRRNVLSDSSFESGTSGFTAPFGAWNTLDRGGSHVRTGSMALRVNRTSVAGDARCLRFTSPSLTVGTHVFSAYVYLPDFVASVGLQGGGGSATWTAGTLISHSGTRDQWERVSLVINVTAAGTVILDFNGTGSAVGSIWIDDAQLEPTSLTPHQSTTATGVDVAQLGGLVLEGGTSNIIENPSFESGAANWSAPFGHGAGGIGQSAAQKYSGSYSGLYTCDVVSGDPRYLRYVMTATERAKLVAGKTYTASAYVYSSAPFWPSVAVETSLTVSGAVSSASRKTSGEWQRIWVTFKVDATTGTHFYFNFSGEGNYTGQLYVDAFLLEESPFPTSYTDTTRSPDLAGICQPHNLLKWSEDFSNAVWLKESGASVSPSTPTKISKTATANAACVQKVTTKAAGVHTVKVSAWAGTLSKATVIVWNNTKAKNVTALTVVNLASTPQGFIIPVTNAADVSAGDELYIYVYPDDRSQAVAGDINVSRAQLVEGSHPGQYVKVTDTPILAPVSPALDPAWQQNGAVEFDVVPPPATTGMLYCLFGAQGTTGNEVLRLFREGGTSAASHSVSFDRKHNGASGSSGVAGRGRIASTATLYDGAKHRIRLEWLNYTLNGVRSMIQRVYVDGVLAASQDVAALYGATEWSAPSASVLVSDGGTIYTTLSDLTLESPTLPAGAIPAV